MQYALDHATKLAKKVEALSVQETKKKSQAVEAHHTAEKAEEEAVLADKAALEKQEEERVASESFSKETRHSMIQPALQRAEAAHLAAHDTQVTAITARFHAEVTAVEADRADKDAAEAEKERLYYAQAHTEKDESIVREFASLREEIRIEARKAKLRVVFRAFDFENQGSLNEDQFFEVGKALNLSGEKLEFKGFDLDFEAASGDSIDVGSEWTRENNVAALDDIMRKREEAAAITADFTIRNVGDGRVCTVDEFVEYFMEKLKDIPDDVLNQQIADFIAASATARHFVHSSSERALLRREKMMAIYKGFDVQETGQITLADFRRVGRALNWGKWTERQNKKLHAAMDANHDNLVVLEEFLFYYRSVIYDIDDDTFERGLLDFQDAVARCLADK